jgi:hypothetical protein
MSVSDDEENLMSHTPKASHDEIGAIDDRGRRWYQLRPKPRRRTDLWGFNSTWWMALGWGIVILVAISPYPWW